MENKELFSKRLRKIRRERDVTLKTLADFLGIKNQSVSVYEKGGGYPTTENLLKLAKFFDISVDFLLGRTDNPNSHKSSN
jgi:transcriptional regulator with XRE-family HTH domain